MNNKLLESLSEDLLIDGDFETREVHINGRLLRPERSQKIRNHSPDGFNWGYGGSGPAQLALAILMQYMPQEDAQSLYQSFKWNVVATWPRTDFEISINLKEEINKILNTKQSSHANTAD